MKHLLSLAFCLLATLAARPSTQTIEKNKSITATDNKIVREDRVWVKEIDDSYTVREWFEGMTVIGGQTYHNLHVKETYRDATYDHITAYMREENGRVYSRAAKSDEIDWGHAHCGINVYDKEYLAYDFNIYPGDILYRFENPADWPASDEFGFKMNEMHVMSDVTIESLGNTYQGYSIIVPSTDQHRNGYPSAVYETLGDLEMPLCLPCMYNLFDSGYVTHTMVYDLDGNLLFDSRDCQNLSAVDAEILPVTISGRFVNVPDPSDDCRVEIYDVMGHCVLTAVGRDCETVALDGLCNGIFVVKANDRGRSLTGKIAL